MYARLHLPFPLVLLDRQRSLPGKRRPFNTIRLTVVIVVYAGSMARVLDRLDSHRLPDVQSQGSDDDFTDAASDVSTEYHAAISRSGSDLGMHSISDTGTTDADSR